MSSSTVDRSDAARPAPPADTADDLDRARALHRLARRASGNNLRALDDGELLHLLAEHRWAVGRLARAGMSLELRSALNATVLTAHGVLYRRARRRRASVGDALRMTGRGIAICTAVFFGAALLAATVVLADPVAAYGMVPRSFLAQIDADAWGSRSSTSSDVGMTLFYWSNNLRASFMALGLGVLGGLPALLVIAFNGALLGAVAAIATTRGVFPRLLGWLGPHGVPELSALILCGAVGLALGRSWLEPGWRTRRAALGEAGRRLTPLVLVAAILVLCAAPLEGFVAPRDLPGWVDSSIAAGWAVLLSLAAAHAVRSSRAVVT